MQKILVRRSECPWDKYFKKSTHVNQRVLEKNRFIGEKDLDKKKKLQKIKILAFII